MYAGEHPGAKTANSWPHGTSACSSGQAANDWNDWNLQLRNCWLAKDNGSVSASEYFEYPCEDVMSITFNWTKPATHLFRKPTEVTVPSELMPSSSLSDDWASVKSTTDIISTSWHSATLLVHSATRKGQQRLLTNGQDTTTDAMAPQSLNLGGSTGWDNLCKQSLHQYQSTWWAYQCNFVQTLFWGN